MSKKTRKVQKEVLESANKIWLAGLGALSVAEEEGGKLFNTLVKKGEGFEKRGKKQFEKVQNTVEEQFEKVQHNVEEQLETVAGKADSAFGRIGKGFDAKVGDTLNKLGVPNRMEIQKLTRRVEQLTKQVDSLNKKPVSKAAPKTAAKAASKAVSTKKATARTRATKTA